MVIAVDAGTTGVRAFAVDADSGQPAGYRYQELTQHFPRPGWVEHDATEIADAVGSTLAGLVGSLDTPVAAVGVTNQRETVVVWDRRTGLPLAPAIVWQDRRTADRCAALTEAGHLPLVRERTGLVLDPYFSATKLAWLLTEGGLEAGPDLAFGTVDSWVIFNLTGGAVHVTDASNASRTLLYDIRTLAWSDELCDLFGVPASVLPEVGPSSGRVGNTVETSAVGAGVPVSGIAGDQQAALFGQTCFAPGDTKNTYGTGSFVLMNVGQRCPDPVEGLLTTVAWTMAGQPGATYALEGAIFATGAAVQWLRDGLGIIADAAEVEALAAEVDDTGGVYLVPAFTGLGSPWWDPYARGTVVGITRGTGRAALARASLESMAYATRDVVEAMSATSGHTVPGLRADGGASANGLLLQLQADQLQVPVTRPVVQETTALGAAYLAGLAEGIWSSMDEVAGLWEVDVEILPAAGAPAADRLHAGWLRAVERSLAWER
ncbi:MAG: glycerol kinase GlpK [Acidimicrobiia bacterium]|nr:glycerol kinase GlpK [Acidimicrobiia bacterium]